MNEIENIIQAAKVAHVNFLKAGHTDREVLTAVNNAVRFLVADLESVNGLLRQARKAGR